jgi:hypothetical protein
MGNRKKLTVGIAGGTKADCGVCINGHAFVARGKCQQVAADICQPRSPRQPPNLFGRLAIVLRDRLMCVSHGRPRKQISAHVTANTHASRSFHYGVRSLFISYSTHSAECIKLER